MMLIRQALAQLEELGGDELVRGVVDLYLVDAPFRLSEARAAVQAGDVKTAARAVHSLKSNSAQLGLAGLSALCGRMESMAKAGDLAGIAPLLSDAERLSATAVSNLRRVHGEMTAT